MTLTINLTFPLEKSERELLLKLLSEEKSEEKALPKEKKTQIGVREDAFGTQKVRFPKVHGRGKETVLAIIKYLEGSATREEISGETNMSDTTIKGYLWELQRDGFLAKSGERPPRYFFKNEGDPALKDMLKNFKGKATNR